MSWPILGPDPLAGGVPPLTAPIMVAIYGDSFGQRAQDILGSPGVDGENGVNPVIENWATYDTSRVGGVTWGPGAWAQYLSRGKYRMPYQMNRAIGGLNTGQLSQTTGTVGEWLTKFEAFLGGGSEFAADAVLLHAGTNDPNASFSAQTSYNNLVAIGQAITGLGVKLVWHTVLPRGNTDFPGARYDETGVQWANDLNAMMLANFEGEFAEGMAKVIDPRATFHDTGSGEDYDIFPALAYDGLHLSPDGCRLLADAILGGLDDLLPVTLAPDLAAPGDLGELGAKALFAGTGGATTGGGVTGDAADNWTVQRINWQGDLTVTCTVEPAAEGNAQVVEITGDTSAGTNGNTQWISINTSLDLSGLTPGDHFEAMARIELSGTENLQACDIELRIAEPDLTTRDVRACQPPPNNTNLMEWASVPDYTGADALIVRTPPRIVKEGSYGASVFDIRLAFPRQVASVAATAKVSQATVRKVSISAPGA